MRLYVEKPKYIIKAIKYGSELTDELKALGFEVENSDLECPACKEPYHKHIKIQRHFVCPNSYLIIGKDGLQVMSEKNFESIYTAIDRESALDVEFKEGELQDENY